MSKLMFFIMAMVSVPLSPLVANPKLIGVTIGNSILHDTLRGGLQGPGLHYFQFKFDEDGVLSQMSLSNQGDFVTNYSFSIVKSGNSIAITRGDLSTKLSWDDHVLTITSRQKERELRTSQILFGHGSDFIYRSEDLLLRETTEGLEEVFLNVPAQVSANRFDRGTLFVDYGLKGNVNNKYVYSKDGGIVNARYYIAMDGSFDESFPSIKIDGDNIYTTNLKVSVINYFVLRSFGSIFQEIFFPVLFQNYVDKPTRMIFGVEKTQ